MSATVATADTVTIEPSADNTIYEGDEGNSNGGGDHFFAGMTDGEKRRRALLAFDISGSLPAGVTVTSVSLQLNMSRTIAGSAAVRLHPLLVTWGEGTTQGEGQEGKGAPAGPGDATWTHRFWETVTWSANGAQGDYVGTASATTTVGNEGTYLWSSGQMAADVQGWLDDPTTNHGWIMIGNEAMVPSAKRFDSREISNSNKRPKLTIEFEANGACCFPDESCQELTLADCTTQGGTYQGAASDCSPNPCLAPTGACCFADGSCTDATATACLGFGGVYIGDGVACVPNPCPQPTGACCFTDGICATLTMDDCATQGGNYEGDNEPCSPIRCEVVLTPFVDPLPLPADAVPVEPNVYELSISEFSQQLHSELAPTTVWGFNGSYPGPTIHATTGTATTVTWKNDLPDTDHYLTVDTCAHGADDQSRRTVIHLHGGHVPPEVDGYPDAWFLPGFQDTYVYPNIQPAATIWYHDHALGITRLNVYMGMAGFYLIHDDVEAGLALPTGEFDIPLVIQDRRFLPDGTLYYPDTWQQHFFGDKILVNGKVWPFLDVKQAAYRFRLLNGSNSRVYTLTFGGLPFDVIATDGGLLETPVTLTELTMSPGERVEIVVDFSAQPAGAEFVLVNSAPAPFPGDPGVGVVPNVMKFVVTADTGPADPVPGALADIEPILEAKAIRERQLILKKDVDPCTGEVWLINGLGWDDITEELRRNQTEIWSFVNRSGLVHPMHMHLVFFQVLDRQNFVVVDDVVVPVGDPVPPLPQEAGWKDTVQVDPDQIVRVIATFTDFEGLFPYHCHILEHEDHEMMRQFRVMAPCDADLDGDDSVGFNDLLVVLSSWGPCPGGCLGDIDGNEDVGFNDLLIVLSSWGSCP